MVSGGSLVVVVVVGGGGGVGVVKLVLDRGNDGLGSDSVRASQRLA
jgi:hypothetical protein